MTDDIAIILEEQTKLLRAINAGIGRLCLFAEARRASTAPVDVASDRDLDGPNGNPSIKSEPRGWTGPSMKGLRFSECPAEYLDQMAEYLMWQAKKSDEKGEVTKAQKPVSTYKRLDAARARGWAKRKRDGKIPDAPARPLATDLTGGSGWATDPDDNDPDPTYDL